MKYLIRVLTFVVVIILALVVAKDAILVFLIEKEAKGIIGIHLDIRSLRLGLANTTIEIKGFKAYNSPEFEKKLMVDIPEIYADFVLRDLFDKKIYLKELNIFATEFNVVRNSKGELNINAIKVVKKEQEGDEVQKEEKFSFEIDVFRLKLDKVVFTDYSKGPTPQIKEFKINVNQEFYGITNPDSLVQIVVLKAMRDTRLAGVLGFDLGALQNSVSGILGGTNNAARKAASGAAKTLAGVANGLSETTNALERTIFPVSAESKNE